MIEDDRFSSLRGTCRQLLIPDDYEHDVDEELEYSFEDADEETLVDELYDGGSGPTPQPLARLGDVISV